MSGLNTWRDRYRQTGWPTVPLYSNAKRPILNDWQTTPPAVQWATAGDRAGNIALRAGNGFAVADADSPQAVETLSRVLAGLGLKPPIVETPSGGRHYYLKLTDAPADRSVHHWLPDVGNGELRFGPGALVTAPPSAIGERRYHFLPGTSPEDWLKLRALRWRDVEGLLKPNRSTQPIDTLPVPLPRRELTDWAAWLLDALATLPPGRPVRVGRNGTVIEYASRSEAEQAVIGHAAWCGWSQAEVAVLFEQHQPGHYAAHADRETYLLTCWRNALNLLVTTDARLTIADLWRWAERRDWPGRNGQKDRAVYAAVLQRAFLADTLEVDFSRRDGEDVADVGDRAARGAMKRFAEQGLIAPVGRLRHATDARTWTLLTAVLEGHERV